VSLKILDHEILPRKLVVVREVVDELMVHQPLSGLKMVGVTRVRKG